MGCTVAFSLGARSYTYFHLPFASGFRVRVCVRERARYVCVRERARCVCERESEVCVCVKESEVCLQERERGVLSVCERERSGYEPRGVLAGRAVVHVLPPAFGFRVQSSGFRVQGAGFRVFRVEGGGSRVERTPVAGFEP